MRCRAVVRRTTRNMRVTRVRITSGAVMRLRLILVIAGVVCLSPVLGGLLLAQAPAAAPATQKPTVPRGQSTNITRREPPSDKPAPRSAAGKILLGAATPAGNGLWTPQFGILDPILEANKVPFK